MSELFKFSGVANFDEFSLHIEKYTAEERYVRLAEFLQTRVPAEITPGYHALAALLEEDYFDLVLSTNMDPLLEDALADARLWRKDYLLLVNGIIRPEKLKPILKGRSPRLKILKLHGDLFHRTMAWTLAEMEAFDGEIKPYLEKVLDQRDMVIVGYSMNDKPIRELVAGRDADTAIWYLHPTKVPESLQKDERVRAVIGEECKFEQLFTALASQLGARVATQAQAVLSAAAEETRPVQRTIDDLLASVVGLVPVNGKVPICTGVLLEEPRVIVTEGFSGGRFQSDGKVKVLTSTGVQLETELLHRDLSHPFGPAVFAAPKELNAPGLPLDRTKIADETEVRIVVAAGSRVGISSGLTVTAAELEEVQIMPVGKVSGLAEVAASLAPGSAGAPVVDADTLAVRGLIVASAAQAVSYFYPVSSWPANLTY